MSDLVKSIRERYLSTLEKISDAANTAGRDPESVKLVVVTKAQPVEVARAAIEAADVAAARNAGCEGIVLGRALLEGRFTLADALREVAAC